jgi:hypothetical protein
MEINPKYNEVKNDVAHWVAQVQRNNKLLEVIAKKLLIFFPTEADFVNNFGLINNFVVMVF